MSDTKISRSIQVPFPICSIFATKGVIIQFSRLWVKSTFNPCRLRILSFSCSQCHPSSICPRLWLQCVWESCPFRILSPAESEEEQHLASFGTVEGLYDTQPFQVNCYRKKKQFLIGTRVLEPLQKSGNYYLRNYLRRDARSFWGLCEFCAVHRCRPISAVRQGWSCICPTSLIHEGELVLCSCSACC